MVYLSLCLAFLAASPDPVQDGGAGLPFESDGDLTPRCTIDELVNASLRRLDIQPARLCSDAVFLRRVSLDVIGTVPTLEEAKAFLEDRNPDKRSALIERLLERDEFADYWAMGWADILRIKAEFPINLWPNAVQTYHRWIRTAIKENMPYDRFARELLTASGSNFRVPPVNFYRAIQSSEPAAIAEAVAQTFMGMRTKDWPPERLARMAAFFAHVGFKGSTEWKEEIVFFDAAKARADREAGTAPAPAFPDGTAAALPLDKDPREVFADWLIRPENPFFARAAANRLWYWLQGRGIIHEPDDIRPDNPPANPELLAYLEKELVAARYDLLHLYRLILNSKTYQLSSVPRTDRPEGVALFAFYPLRRLPAEVLIDALCQITGTTESYSSPIPEPFTFIPEEHRSIALADGSITSSFLEMFGRPPRDTGLVSERNDRPTAAQRLHLLNSSHIRQKIDGSPRLRSLLPSGRNPGEAVKNIYLTILSRHPTEAELDAVRAYVRSGKASWRAAAVDVIWALVNGAEFLYRH